MRDGRINKVKAVLIGARLPTLLASLSPVIIGQVLAWRQLGPENFGDKNVAIFMITAIAAMLMQAGANFVNDLKDGLKGVDSDDRKGPLRLGHQDIVSSSFIRRCYLTCFLLAFVLSAILAYFGGTGILVLAAICIGFAYLYTGGPWPLSYVGLGEVAALIFFGPVAVVGSYYLQTLQWNPWAALWGVGPGLLAGAMMAINNYRDIDSDRRSQKMTLAVRLGSSKAGWIPKLFLLLTPILVAWFGILVGNPIGAVIAGLFVAMFILHKIFPLLADQAMLNQALKRTAGLNLIYGVAFSLVAIL
jgi:1,4-dihydroxy-2-naphthoate octaprenyltransferase